MARTNFWNKLFGSALVAQAPRKRRAHRSWNSLQRHGLTRKLKVEGLEARVCLNGSWATEAPMPTPRRSFEIAADPASGLIYAVGGRSAPSPEATTENEVYDPATNSWAIKTPLPSPHADGGAAFVDGVLYVIGGYTGSGFTAGVEAYNPATDTWTARASVPEVSVSFGIAVVDDIIYVIGGNNTSTALAHTYAYDPATDSWMAKAPYPGNIGAPAVGVLNGIIYAAGGQGTAGTVATVEAYDPVTDTWTAKADMLTPRQEAAGSVVGGRLYVMGGGFFGSSGNSGPLATVEVYDPASDTWTADTSMPTARLDPGAATVNGVIYVLGGRDEPDHKFGANEAFTPIQTSFVSVVGGSFVYDGLPHGATSSSVTGAGGLNTVADSFSYAGTGATTYGPTSTPPTDSGTYSVIATYNGDATHSGSVSAPADITINKADVDATGSTESSINISKAGTIMFELSNVTAILARDGTVYDLFNGATFQLRIGGENGTLYSVSSTAVVLANGSIQISWRMTQELYNDLHSVLGSATPSNKTPVDFFISGTSTDGNYLLTGDAFSRICQQGKVNFT
jgi:N-acetylneuraminic acid mutarotase